VVKDMSDLPTTLRETLSEATLELYLKAYRQAYETLVADASEESSLEAEAHEAAMRVVEQESMYDQEEGKWYHQEEMERVERRG
jgi:cation transport regulator ChaB